MRKIFFAGIMLFSILAMTVETVFAGAVVSLVEVRNDDGGVTFVFKVNSDFSRSDLNGGRVHVNGGGDFPLYCNQQDEETVVCHTSDRVSGAGVVVDFGGSRFWSLVPEQRTYLMSYCYMVYDWAVEETSWENIGGVCQKRSADVGDSIYFYNPAYGDYYYYSFLPQGQDYLSWPNPGVGYYYIAN